MLGEVIAGRGQGESAGLVIALDGALGAGKTVFVKGLAEGLGIPADQVSSPTFVIAQQYQGAHGRLNHIDLYRLDDERELDDFGFDELLDPPQVAAVEWASRFPGALPNEGLDVSLARPDARVDGVTGERRVSARARGARAAAILERWVERVDDR